jgi:uncharacterized membrane protein
VLPLGGFPVAISLPRPEHLHTAAPEIYGSGAANQARKGAAMPEANQVSLSDNAAGAIAYITFIPAVVFLLVAPYNSNPYVRFHSWQSILLNATAAVISLFFSIVLVFSMVFGAFFLLAFTRIIWLAWVVLWLVCVLKAMNGRRFKIPLLGDFAEKQAGN